MTYAQKYALTHETISPDYVFGYLDIPILDRLFENYSLLDVGCGTAGYYQLLKNYRRIVGVDPSVEMLVEAEKFRSRFGWRNVEFVNSRFEDVDIKEQFDIVRIPGIYGFYASWSIDAMHKVRALLKPSGIAILGAVVPRSIYRRVRKLVLGPLSKTIFESSFHKLLARAGLQSVFRIGLPHVDFFFVKPVGS
ncbi:MAG: class I SAM-dependent methyltransferase [Sulfurifustis sp.]